MYLYFIHFSICVIDLNKPVMFTGPMATGCNGLGQLKNGFYIVKSASSNKLIVVYCDFSNDQSILYFLANYSDMC
jgi:hypothetical protein